MRGWYRGRLDAGALYRRRARSGPTGGARDDVAAATVSRAVAPSAATLDVHRDGGFVRARVSVRSRLLPGLVMEAIPGVGVLPFWLLVVGAIAVWGTARPKLR